MQGQSQRKWRGGSRLASFLYKKDADADSGRMRPESRRMSMFRVKAHSSIKTKKSDNIEKLRQHLFMKEGRYFLIPPFF